MHKKRIYIIVAIVLFVVLVKVALGLRSYLPLAFQLLFNKNIELRKSDSRINILVLGTGGGVHDGPNLTDTIIFTSIDQKNKQIYLVSIPRDLWIPDLEAKINTAYSEGEIKKKGGGISMVRAVVEKVLNQPVDYVVRLDFAGFVRAVDLVGGIDVNVENSFDDYEYPIEGKEDDLCGNKPEEVDLLATSSSALDAFPCRYIHIHFDKGIQHMDGQTALRYVRSRHALGEEGTDFARSKRQEKVIAALKSKIFSPQTFLNPVKLAGLYSAIKDNIDTDINQNELDDFMRLADEMRSAQIKNVALDMGDEKFKREGLLINPINLSDYQGQWVLIPKAGNSDFLPIQKYISCEIKSDACPVIKKN